MTDKDIRTVLMSIGTALNGIPSSGEGTADFIEKKLSDAGLKITKEEEWRDISTAKEDCEPVLLLLAEGDIVDGHWEPKEDDGLDSMGHDAGWHDNVCATFPSRSFGNPKYYSEAVNPPTHWQPRPEDPQDNEP